ncbi:50S ribosomal protein L35ae [Candidatus Woesearchaeota archaeon]|nr:50S ribosomal protein L35ae [Candidatus Woesearchaeota archaeon]
MEATVMHFRQSRYRVNSHQMVLKAADSAEEAQKVIGKKVVWTSPAGTQIQGTISALHGRKGNVRVIFPEKGLPGQALGQKVKVE